MKEKLVKLISVKSIVTILLTLVFSYLALVGIISAQDFMTVFTVVIAFYFGTQHEKKTLEVAPVQETICGDVVCPYKADGGEVVEV
jgi:hypothetical protein